MKRTLLIVSVLCTLSGLLRAQNVEDLQARNRRLQEEIATLEERISSTADNFKGQLNRYRLGQRLLSSRQELIRGMETALARLTGGIAQRNRMIVALKQEREELTTA